MKIAERLRRLEQLDQGRDRADALRRAPPELRAVLASAYSLVDQGVAVEAWPDRELAAYCAVECRDLAHLSDRQLEALVNENIC